MLGAPGAAARLLVAIVFAVAAIVRQKEDLRDTVTNGRFFWKFFNFEGEKML
jgi:hypothetical protein